MNFVELFNRVTGFSFLSIYFFLGPVPVGVNLFMYVDPMFLF